MVIDSSAILALLMNEPEAEQLAIAIDQAAIRRMSVANFLEASIVIEARHGLAGGSKLDELIEKAHISMEPVTVEQAEIARIAYRAFGKGRHPAGLNFGDCFAYALAKTQNEPLLFKGDDFTKTDIQIAVNL
ncbi:MAG: type II toxin-antitoxin system VapC family toxin [Anaerolineales bacterium]|nr:type II toxin-antitoxin system VapC family toxin [Anaerolineales bacterium]